MLPHLDADILMALRTIKLSYRLNISKVFLVTVVSIFILGSKPYLRKEGWLNFLYICIVVPVVPDKSQTVGLCFFPLNISQTLLSSIFTSIFKPVFCAVLYTTISLCSMSYGFGASRLRLVGAARLQLVGGCAPSSCWFRR